LGGKRNMTYAAIAVVLVNAVVLLAHDSAHRSLGILLSPWQEAFIYSVIVAGPILALLVLRQNEAYGYALLILSMLGSFLFGVYHHFIAVSPDHVAHLPPGGAQCLFRVTAVLMAITQGAGAFIAAVGLARRRSQHLVPPV
jgi:hypothetical protein